MNWSWTRQVDRSQKSQGLNPGMAWLCSTSKLIYVQRHGTLNPLPHGNSYNILAVKSLKVKRESCLGYRFHELHSHDDYNIVIHIFWSFNDYRNLSFWINGRGWIWLFERLSSNLTFYCELAFHNMCVCVLSWYYTTLGMPRELRLLSVLHVYTHYGSHS